MFGDDLLRKGKYGLWREEGLLRGSVVLRVVGWNDWV